ncbi:hypothetical protein OG470_15685 [Micromonospora sp. NBC_00389]|uniref:hypothetical protein n=1 Tax=Micromonospora sp. NBC_00389 TaxID=2903586 RepID=UPI002E22F6E3
MTAPTCYPDTIATLETQGYRHVPTAPGCAHGLTRASCRTCGLYPHRDGCDYRWLDHGLIVARDGTRYLYAWLYQDPDRVQEWAALYAHRHGLTYRINHPDDLEAYCPGVTSIRYHRTGEP